MPTTPRPTGNSPPKMLAPNLSTYTLQSDRITRLVESAAQLCEAEMASIRMRRDEAFQYVASFGFSREFSEVAKKAPSQAGRGTLTGRTLLSGKPVHILDAAVDPEYTFTQGQKIPRFRTLPASLPFPAAPPI